MAWTTHISNTFSWSQRCSSHWSSTVLYFFFFFFAHWEKRGCHLILIVSQMKKIKLWTIITIFCYLNRNVRKRPFGHVRLVKIQISLRIRAVWSESSLGAYWTAKGAKFLHANNEDFNQTARMRRLIWVFVGRTCEKVRFLTLRFLYSQGGPFSTSNTLWFGKTKLCHARFQWAL